MKNEIKLGGVDVKLVSNALTPFVYTEIFRKDFFRVLLALRTLENKDAKTYTDEDFGLVLSRMGSLSEAAFVMAKQGEGLTAAELVQLSRVDYLEWLAGFEADAFQDGATIQAILQTWQGQAVGDVDAKN